jgi:hypothetical protein
VVTSAALSSILPPESIELLRSMPYDDAMELACRADLGVWSERKRGFTNSALHWEWARLAQTRSRLAVCAPREHSKTETFTVNQIAWRVIYTPGLWCFVFAQTGDQAKMFKERIDQAVEQAAPWMVKGEHGMNTSATVYANWSKVQVAGAGKSMRGVHPDVIVGDDVLEEGNCLTSLQRKRIERWWFGTIGGMSHPRTSRALGSLSVGSDDTGGHAGSSQVMVEYPGSVVHLVGTPFHQQDLLMNMRENPLYEFRRYSAEFGVSDLVPGTLAVEVN